MDRYLSPSPVGGPPSSAGAAASLGSIRAFTTLPPSAERGTADAQAYVRRMACGQREGEGEAPSKKTEADNQIEKRAA